MDVSGDAGRPGVDLRRRRGALGYPRSMEGDVVDDAAGSRLVVTGDGGAEAELVYERNGGRLHLLHTEVPAAFRGQGIGGHLVSGAVVLARREGLVVVPWCPFARRWLHEHPHASDGVAIDFKTPPPPVPEAFPRP